MIPTPVDHVIALLERKISGPSAKMFDRVPRKGFGIADPVRDAHKVLHAVYASFTEGFDTKDLQDAKALLNRSA